MRHDADFRTSDSQGGAMLAGGRRARGVHRAGRPGIPLVSVVLPILNGGDAFVAALESVLGQTYENVEVIVMDGGSTDGTLDVLRARDSSIDVWVSASDGGVYSAMNKGIRLARGEFIAILNADDGYMPDALERAVGAMVVAKASYAFGSVTVRDADGSPRFAVHPLADPDEEARSPSGRMPFPHITMVVARNLYHNLGAYDTRYRVAADYDFALRLMRSGAPGVRVAGTLGWVTAGGMSDSIANLAEKRAIVRQAGAGALRASLVFASSVVKRWVTRTLPPAALARVLKWRGTRVQGWPAA